MFTSLIDVSLPELLLCFLLLLSCRVASSSSELVFNVGVNCATSAVASVTSSRVDSTFDLAVLWSVVIVLIFFSQPMDASLCVSNLSLLIHAQESQRVAIIFSLPCLNWLSFREDSILCLAKIFFDLNRSSSSVVFGKCFLYSFPVGKSLGCAMIRPSCIMMLSDESRSFVAAKILQWLDTIFMVLFPVLGGELNSTIIGVVYLSFTNLISVACLIIISRISVLYGFGLVRLSVTNMMKYSSG